MFKSKLQGCLLLGASLLTFIMHDANAKEPAKSNHVQSDEEAFLIRRIAEFWKDGDFAIVKTQIIDFLNYYPKSELADYFQGILADIYLQDNNYEKALSTYLNIQDKDVMAKTLINKLQCYYELDKYENLANDGRPYLSSNVSEITQRKDELYFLMGEALFRLALKEDQLEKKQNLVREAREYYGMLPSGQYSEVSEFATAEIAAILGDFEYGAQAYRALAEKHPQMKEDLLFQVASLEAHYNKLGAAETFRKVKDMEGKRMHEATFNLLVLLFQNEEYEEIVSTYEKISANAPESFQPTFDFVVGKSFFSLGDFQSAISYLKSYVDAADAPSEQLKNALLIQMTCAHQTNNEGLFSTSFEKLNDLFPNDSEIPKALFMHAMILKEQGAIIKADEKLQVIKENYPEFQGEESFIFEYGLLSHQNERWQDSYETFRHYVSKFDESERIDAAWKLFLSSSINLYKHAESEDGYTKSNFYKDLQAVLAHSNYLNDQELIDYALLYAKTAYELDYYTDSLRCLQDHVFVALTEEENPQSLAEAHFIAGLCHAEVQADHSAFCMHLEQAMLLNPDLYDSGPTHLQLYNAYISLAGYGDMGGVPADGAQQKDFVDHAAEHLQEAVSRGGIAIKNENRLWLANYYFQKVEHCNESDIANLPEVASAIDRATGHYQKILFNEGTLVEITANNLHLENEVIKLAKLFDYQKAYTQKLDLVKLLLQQQSEKPMLNWSSQKSALYELASVYNAMGDKEKAFETYSFIHTQANHFPTSIASSATLEAAKLHFELLENELRTESNQEVVLILNDLKELQIRKSAFSEPTHLEAALEYAKIRAMLSSSEERDARYLFFLSRIKDDFTSQEDLVTKDYLVNLSKNPEKKAIFDAYMKFIDAETLRMESKNLYKQERLGEMEEVHESALTIYSELKNDSSTPEDLFDRTLGSIHEINALVAY